jgi:hypothetical protein
MQIVEPDQVARLPQTNDILAFTVPRDLHQIGDAEETGRSRELRRDLRKLDGAITDRASPKLACASRGGWASGTNTSLCRDCAWRT